MFGISFVAHRSSSTKSFIWLVLFLSHLRHFDSKMAPSLLRKKVISVPVDFSKPLHVKLNDMRRTIPSLYPHGCVKSRSPLLVPTQPSQRARCVITIRARVQAPHWPECLRTDVSASVVPEHTEHAQSE